MGAGCRLSRSDPPIIMVMDIVVRSVRGLEWVAAAEARGRLSATVQRVRHREVWLRAARLPAELAGLRVADDVFFHAGNVPHVGHTRQALSIIARGTSSIDWAAAAKESGRSQGPFDVVGSFLGRRNYNRFELEDAVGQAVAAQTRWAYLQRRPDRRPVGERALTIRVHIEDDEAALGIRLADRPLHRRAWKRVDVPGTLHPPVAAALVLAAGLRPASVLADPFCGAGTVGIEALLTEPTARVFLSDLRHESVAATLRNASSARVQDRLLIATADAARPPLRSASVDRLVTNPPWSRLVEPEGLLRERWEPFVETVPKVLRNGGRGVLLVDMGSLDAFAMMAERAGCAVVGSIALSVSGAWVAMLLLGTSPGPTIDPYGLFGGELAAALADHKIEAGG